MGASRDEMHLCPGLGESAAEIATDAARPKDRDMHVRHPSGPATATSTLPWPLSRDRSQHHQATAE